ncbi:MAG: archease [Halobacteriaceae archaeon]
MPYTLREHTADVAVEATGDSLGAVYAAVADGLAAAMADDVPAAGERFDLSVDAESREAALFDYLDRLIYERDVRGVLPVDNEATVSTPDAGGPGGGDDRVTVDASARGVPLAAVDAREVKAVTYSEMALERTDGGWRAYVVFDV